MALLEVKDLEVYYGMIQAIKGVSFKVNEGEVVALIGANGAGKTTILHTVTRLLEAKRGSVVFDGKDITKTPAHKIVSMGMAHVPEGRRVFANLSVLQNLKMGAYTRKDKNEIEETLKNIYKRFPRLEERQNQLAGTLSGGEQQMLAMGRALMSHPRIILMDEPFGAVDPLNRANLQNEFLKIQKQLKKTVIFVTHDIDEAMKMGDKIAIMSKGILRNFASPEDTLLSDDEFVKSFLGSETYIKILSRFRVKEHMRPQNGADIPYHADCEANLRDVLAQMIEYGTDSMHVTEKGKITGTILLSDILNLFQKGRKGE